jgi:hypothetical protein
MLSSHQDSLEIDRSRSAFSLDFESDVRSLSDLGRLALQVSNWTRFSKETFISKLFTSR